MDTSVILNFQWMWICQLLKFKLTPNMYKSYAYLKYIFFFPQLFKAKTVRLTTQHLDARHRPQILKLHTLND
jgi:hypothetical protein